MITTTPRERRDPRKMLIAAAMFKAYKWATREIFVQFFDKPDPLALQWEATEQAHAERVGPAGRRVRKSDVHALAARIRELIAEDQFEQELLARKDERDRIGNVEGLLDRAADLYSELCGVLDRVEAITATDRSRGMSQCERNVRLFGFDLNGNTAREKFRELWRFYVVTGDGRPAEELPAYQRHELGEAAA